MANNHNQPPLIGRRGLLGVALSALVVAAVGSGEKQTLTNAQSMTKLPEVPISKYNILPLKTMDIAYIRSLLQGLTSEGHDIATKVKAVKSSLRLIRNYSDNTPATAFQIDEGGYYITAAHALPRSFSNQAIVITNPYNGELSKVNGLVVGHKADVAIVYAPNSNPLRPVEGLQLDFTGLEDGQELSMLALCRGDGNTFRRASSGMVDRGVSLPEKPDINPETRVAVRGMIPYGGTSGGPIVNNQGNIVAVVSGFYPPQQSSPNTYTGAVITPINYAQI